MTGRKVKLVLGLACAHQLQAETHFYATTPEPMVNWSTIGRPTFVLFVIVAVLWAIIAVTGKYLGSAYKKKIKDYQQRKLETTNAIIDDIKANMKSLAVRVVQPIANLDPSALDPTSSRRPSQVHPDPSVGITETERKTKINKQSLLRAENGML
eukprot:c24373_g1_i1.p1 GENE.c24373_g1_i1~~c24373_g1_i1.p1  ORF type:complete len:165 (+),score=28.84 c24373_g1_i1:36-497(+)